VRQKFRFQKPPLWRPPFTMASLSDLVINEVPPDAVDLTKYGDIDIIDFVNEAKDLINKSLFKINNTVLSNDEAANEHYVVSRLQLAINEMSKKLSEQHPEFVLTFSLKSEHKYTVLSKAFANAPRRLS